MQGPVFSGFLHANILSMISSWLTKKNQRVAVDNESLSLVIIAIQKYSVPQGTLLGPLMFLIYINNINEHIISSIRLFADDCIMFNMTSMSEQLQKPHSQTFVQGLKNGSLWSCSYYMHIAVPT